MTNPIDGSSSAPKINPDSMAAYPKAKFNSDGTVTFLGMNFNQSDWEGLMKAMLFQMCTFINSTCQQSRENQKQAWQDSMDDS